MSKPLNDELKDLYNEMDFSAEYSDNLPAILKRLNISLAFTSYQAARLIFLRSDGETIDVNFKHFHRPMGLVVDSNSLTLGTFNQIIKFQREDGLIEQIKQPLPRIEQDVTAPKLHKKSMQSEESLEPETAELSDEQKERQAYMDSLYEPVDERVDACYISRSAHYTGMINIHDVAWGEDGLWAVTSSFSCLSTIDPNHSFVPRWKPHFISDLKPEDRCHLNGMAMKDGKPAYVTTFSKSDKAGNWREKEKFDGTLMDVTTNEVVVHGLTMPHSPRCYRGKVYYCNSGEGEICMYDPDTKTSQVIAEVPGFTRGVTFYGPLMFVGLSKVRQSDVTRPSPLREKYDETFSGIWVFNLEDNTEVARVSFTGNVDQIYDVAVLPNCSFPELIEPEHPRTRNHFCFPELQPFN